MSTDVKDVAIITSGPKIHTKDGGRVLDQLEIADIVNRTVFRNFRFAFHPENGGTDEINIGSIAMYTRVGLREYDRKWRWDRYNPVEQMEHSKTDTLQGFYKIPRGITAKFLCEHILRCIARLECHEIQENFYVDGERVFDPHSERGEFLVGQDYVYTWENGVLINIDY